MARRARVEPVRRHEFRPLPEFGAEVVEIDQRCTVPARAGGDSAVPPLDLGTQQAGRHRRVERNGRQVRDVGHEHVRRRRPGECAEQLVEGCRVLVQRYPRIEVVHRQPDGHHVGRRVDGHGKLLGERVAQQTAADPEVDEPRVGRHLAVEHSYPALLAGVGSPHPHRV